MIPMIFRPAEIAEKCFLSEALMWIAFYRPPLAVWGEHGDERFQEDYCYNYEARPMGPDYGMDEEVTWHECQLAKLPLNPAFQDDCDFNEYHYRGETESIKEIIKRIDKDSNNDIVNELNDRLKKARIFEEKCSTWDDILLKYLEISKSKLFIALRENKLKSFGRPLPCQGLEESIAKIEQGLPKPQPWCWQDIEYKEIEENFWRFDNIKWMDSVPRDGNHHYIHIYVNTEELFNVFPFNEHDTTREMLVVNDARLVFAANNLFLLSDPEKKISASPRSGRPPIFKWDEFYLELARRLQSNSIPYKQEAFILEMQNWCMNNWGKSPGRTTILKKVGPYHKESIRQKSESH